MNIPVISSTSQLSLQGEQLSDLIALLPSSAHVRDVQTDKYILANQFQAKNNGFKRIEDVLGITSADLIASNYKKLSKFQASILQIDEFHRLLKRVNYEVEQKKSPISFEECSFSPTGFVFIGRSFKIPILGENKKVVAVFTFSEEITHSIDLFELYLLYKKNLLKKEAIKQFLTYLRIDDYFSTYPTDAEVLTLLNLRQAQTYKFASDLLNVKQVTIESHIQHLREKLKKGENLNNLLMKLRNFNHENIT